MHSREPTSGIDWASAVCRAPPLQRNGLQEGTKSLERRRRKSGQQAVLDPDRLLAVGNAQRTVQRYPMACLEISPIGPCQAGIGASSPPSYSLFNPESPEPDNPGTHDP